MMKMPWKDPKETKASSASQDIIPVIGMLIILAGIFCFSCVEQQLVGDTSVTKETSLDFVSENMSTFRNIFKGAGNGTTIKIQGRLYMPSSLTAKTPAAVILHGVSGLIEDDYQMIKAMNDIGVAALLFDTNKARNISKGSVANRVISDAMRVCDAFAALKVLSLHPGIDKERIAVVGRSRGGLVAMLTASDKIRKSLVGAKLQFAAHVAIYPVCHVQLQDADFSGAPMLMLLAEKDNITPAKICLDYVKRIDNPTYPLKVIVYEGATHGFTHSRFYGRTVTHDFLADYQNCTDRPVQLLEDGSWSFPYKNEQFNEYVDWDLLTADCQKQGEGVLGDPSKVRRKSLEDIQAFLKEAFYQK